MNTFHCRVLLITVSILALLAWWSFGNRDEHAGTRSDSAYDAAGQASGSPVGVTVADGPSPRAPRPQLLKNDRNAGPVITTFRALKIIPEGHSMVTGGCLTADGSREFIVIKPFLVDNGGKQFLISACIFKMTAAGLESSGLKSLVTNEEKTEQNAEVWKPEEVEALLHNQIGMEMVSRPSVYVKPGMSATIRSSKRITAPIDTCNTPLQGDQSDEINPTSMSIEANEAPNGGTELKVEIISER